MGTRGPKQGWKARQFAQAPAAEPLQPAEVDTVSTSAESVEPVRMSAADAANPGKISGDALRKMAHNRGMSRSEMAGMSDDKIRTQLKYLTYRQYEAA